MKKISVYIIVVFFISVCMAVIWKFQKEGSQYAMVKRTLTDDALSFFREDIKELGRKQVMLQQAEIDAHLLQIAKNDAILQAQIAAIPFWQSFKKRVFIGVFCVGCFCSLIACFSACLIVIRRKTLVPLSFGSSQISLPYRQVNSELGAIRVLQTALTEISQGEIDKEDLFRLFQLTRGGHAVTQPAIDVTPETPALSESVSPAITFQEAIKSFHPGQILTGFHEGTPVHLPVKGFVSAAVGGESGSGKTSKLCFMLAQLICSGAYVSILDAHEGVNESLVSRLGSLAQFPNVRIYHPFDTREAVDEMVHEVQSVIDSKCPASPVRVYVLDELRPLNHACDRVEYLMDKLANEGRKFNLFGIFASQTWEASLFKQSGSAARDACVLKIAARMPKDQARILFKDNQAAKEVSRLALPEMYVSSVRYSGIVQVPFATQVDMEQLALEYLERRETPLKQAQSFEPVSETDETIAGTRGVGYSEALPAILRKVADYMQNQDCGLNEFCRRADIFSARGSLSEMLKGNRKLSDEMAQRLIDFFGKDRI